MNDQNITRALQRQSRDSDTNSESSSCDECGSRDGTKVDIVQSEKDTSVVANLQLTEILGPEEHSLLSPAMRRLATRLILAGLLTPDQARSSAKTNEPFVLDRYIILDILGEGGMGMVFKARHQSMDRIVALKVLPCQALDSEEKIQRFRNEIKVTAKLVHPNVVVAFDAHEINGRHFLVMEYVTGNDLREVVRQHGAFSTHEALQIIDKVASGLGEAHKQGIVHRDIKPSNIMLTDDCESKLLDLGLARFKEIESEDGRDDLTRDGFAIGTVAYMSPEQALNSRQVDARSDIYSLGCTLFFLLSGTSPFHRPSAIETLLAHREDEPFCLTQLNPAVPKDVENICLRMIARHPKDRYTSTDELRNDLRNFIAEESSQHFALPDETTTVTLLPTIMSDTETHSGLKPVRSRLGAIFLGTCLSIFSITGLCVAIWIVVPPATEVDHNVDHSALARWIIENNGSFTSLTESGELVVDSITNIPSQPWTITEIVITEPDQNISLNSLATIDQLRSLSLTNLPNPPHGFATLCSMSQLTTLDLIDCDLKDDHLARIGDLHQLRSLDLSSNWITDTSLESVGNLNSLEALYLANNDITDAGIAHLARLEQLRHVDLDDTLITSKSFEILRKLPQLVSLDLCNTEISTADMVRLVQLSRLRNLLLDYCNVADISALKKLRHLEELYLEGTNVSDDSLKSISDFAQLRRLDLAYCDVTATGVRHLRAAKELRELRLSGAALTHSYLRAVVQLKQLETLDLSNTALNDSGLQELQELTNLETLDIQDSQVSAFGIERFLNALPDCEIIIEE